MRKRSQIILMLAAMLSLPALAMAPVAAEGGSSGGTSGSGDSSNTSTTEHTDSTEPTTKPPVSGETETKTETEVHDLESRAKTMLETDRKSGHEHNQLQRQTACKAHQAEINTRVSNYAAAAQRHLTVFDGLLTKVQDFYTTKKLNVSSYAALLATAQSKQADAQTAVDALKALDVSIDCTQPDPAQKVATVKTAVSDARTALQAYRTAIKNLVEAIQGASSAQDKTESSTGGGQ